MSLFGYLVRLSNGYRFNRCKVATKLYLIVLNKDALVVVADKQIRIYLLLLQNKPCDFLLSTHRG